MALSARLLLSPLASLDVGADCAIRCSCGKSFICKAEPYHYLDCPAAQYGFVARHNALRDSLRKFLEERGKPPRGSVQVEPAVIQAENVPQAENFLGTLDDWRAMRRRGPVRADIGRFGPGVAQLFDVVVVNPAAASYRNQPARQAMQDEGLNVFDWQMNEDEVGEEMGDGSSAAVRHREEAKKRKYRASMGDAVDDPSKFVAFVVEATGKLGNSAKMALLQILGGTNNEMWVKGSIFTKIGAIVTRYNAVLARSWIRQLKLADPALLGSE
jgi:hypothetical protein